MLIAAAACADAPPARWIDPSTQIEFVLIPAGEFVMGSPVDEPGHQEDEKAHHVRITEAFYTFDSETRSRSSLTTLAV